MPTEVPNTLPTQYSLSELMNFALTVKVLMSVMRPLPGCNKTLKLKDKCVLCFMTNALLLQLSERGNCLLSGLAHGHGVAGRRGTRAKAQ